MTHTIEQVGVIGLGTMGAGIVEVFARAGITVVAVDGSVELAERGRGFLEKSTGKQVQRGRLSEQDQAALLGRVRWSGELADLSEVDLVVEAVPEQLAIKRDIFTTLDRIVREDAILASNTSSLSLTEIAVATKHPERVVGMHFFNPAPVLKLVEVITTREVDDEVVEAVRELATRLGKKPIVVGDRAGFVANALLITYLARAIRLYEEGNVSLDDIDAAATAGIGLPMGPLRLADLIGLDVVQEICDVLYAASQDPGAAAPGVLRQLVSEGSLGRKTGTGFYSYGGDAEQEPTPLPDDVLRAESPEALVDALWLEGIAVELFEQTPQGRLAEVVAGRADSRALQRARASLSAAGLVPVVVRGRGRLVRDVLLMPHLNDAVTMLESGYASADDIDTAMTAGCGYPKGPIQLLDEIGARPVLERLQSAALEPGVAQVRPAPLLVEHAASGRAFHG